MMAKKEFNLKEILAEQGVSNLDSSTTVGEILSFPLEYIAENGMNFYDTSNVKELADSIALNGLIEPIIVMPADGEKKYRIISGHRRFKAFSQLHAESPEKFGEIPAIVKAPVNEIVEELLLIDANRATRVMSSADTAKQAERLTELFSQLKESGTVEIPGRLRDVVSKAMDISASRLARLKVIREKLIPTYMDAFEKDKLNESVAYEIARLYPLQQEKLSQIVKDTNKLTAYEVPTYGKRLNIYFGPELKCEKVRDPKLQTPTYCTHGEKMWEISKSKSLYSMCSGCCANCWSKSSCKNVCPVIAPDLEKANIERVERDKEEAARRDQQQADAENYLNLFWSRARVAREASGLSAEEAFYKINATCKSRNSWWTLDDDKELIEQENGTAGDSEDDDFCRDDNSPNDFDVILAFADAYGCSIDYLVGRSDNLVHTQIDLRWRNLFYDPPADGQDIITLQTDGVLTPRPFFMDTFDSNNVVGWIPFPEVHDDV